jgi:phage FluMu gp28-like protein
MPERVFQQEIMAQFLEDGAGVFRGVRAAAVAIAQDGPTEKHEYAIGVDWARTDDATVFAVVDITDKALVYLDRMNNTDYAMQRARLIALAVRFKPNAVLVEMNSMGTPQLESLQREGLPVQGFTTTNASKAQIIESLALAFETREITILDDPILTGELMAYQSERLPSGLVRYNAPSGMHDDTVIALALAWYAGVGGATWWMS